jgi:hypothetical protein
MKNSNISELFEILKLEDVYTQNILAHFTKISDDIYFKSFKLVVDYLNIVFQMSHCLYLINNNPEKFGFKNSILNFFQNYKRFYANADLYEFNKWKNSLYNQKGFLEENDSQFTKDLYDYFFKLCCEYRKLHNLFDELHPQIFEIFKGVLNCISNETDKMIYELNSPIINFVYDLLKMSLFGVQNN